MSANVFEAARKRALGAEAHLFEGVVMLASGKTHTGLLGREDDGTVVLDRNDGKMLLINPDAIVSIEVTL